MCTPFHQIICPISDLWLVNGLTNILLCENPKIVRRECNHVLSCSPLSFYPRFTIDFHVQVSSMTFLFLYFSCQTVNENRENFLLEVRYDFLMWQILHLRHLLSPVVILFWWFKLYWIILWTHNIFLWTWRLFLFIVLLLSLGAYISVVSHTKEVDWVSFGH